MASRANVAPDRAVARLVGLLYYRGAPCPHGHPGLRITSSKFCVDCIPTPKFQRHAERFAEWVDLARSDVAFDRDSAVLLGSLYYLGRPCDYGHQAIRYTSGRSCVACSNATSARQRQDDPERANQYSRDWSRRNPGRAYAAVRRWIDANRDQHRELMRAAFHRRRARKLNAPGSHTAAEAEDLLVRQGYRCAYCGTSENLTLDHKVPLSRGGPNSVDNLQWLCGSDNSRKKDRTDDEYRTLRGIPTVTPWDARAEEQADG